MNRMAHPSYPKTVCGVVYQGSERGTGCQFTFTCDGSMARKPMRFFWERAEAVARAALSGFVYKPIGLATHYHTFAVHPAWSDKLAFIGQIGAHRFYRMEGPAGAAATFHFAYAGGEPIPGPHPRAAAWRSSPDTDPVALERAYEAGARQAQNAQSTPARDFAEVIPTYTSDMIRRGGDAVYRASNLPTPHNVQPGYESSGTWIGDPQ